MEKNKEGGKKKLQVYKDESRELLRRDVTVQLYVVTDNSPTKAASCVMITEVVFPVAQGLSNFKSESG